MGRPKRVDVLTVAAGGTREARAEVWRGINNLLIYANATRKATTQPAVQVQRALERASVGATRYALRKWPSGAAIAFYNLISILLIGGWDLRRCRRCDDWFLSKDVRRRTCYGLACKRALAARRQAKKRADTYRQQRLAKLRAQHR